MSVTLSKETGIIVTTLLQVGERVIEVSRDCTITNIWDREGTALASSDDLIGKKITDLNNDNIYRQSAPQVEAAFDSGENNYFEYATVLNDKLATLGIRTINNHPEKDHLFLVIEQRSSNKQDDIVEDKWKLALDASGDGMLDLNLETDAVSFSDKWHEIFGYSAAEIKTGAQWAEKIHPDDLAESRKRSAAYVAGELSSYSAEMRYMCKDGTWKWIQSRGVIVSRNAEGKPLRFIGTHTDINERKLAEGRYSSTAQLLAKLINNLQTGIIVTDEHSDVIYANDVFRETYEKAHNPVSIDDLNILKNLDHRMLSYKDPERFKARTIDILDKGQMALNEEWELLDGRVVIRDYIPLTIGKDNKGGIWKFTDVTTQRNIDKRFETQRLFYERILNNIPADIAVFDAQHRYLFVNKNAFKNDDLRKWMIGKTDVDYAEYSKRPYSFVEARFALYDTAMRDGKQVFIEKLVNKEDKVGYHLRKVESVYFEDGSFEFLMAYGVEITDLIEAQEQLKTSIDTFSSAFDHSGIGMALMGMDGVWINANRVLCDLTGYSKEELEQRSYHDITFPADDGMDRPLINQLLNKEISRYTVDKRYVSKENKIVLVSLTVSLVWKDDVPQFFIAQVVDITQRQALENDIKRKNMELEATRISLVNKINQLEELSHIIAHNLRGPAGNVKMFSEILLSKQDGGTGDNPLGVAFSDAEIAKFINDSSISLMSSLSTLMEITEIKLNKEIPYNTCDVAAVVNGIATQLQSIIYEKHAEIVLDLEVPEVSYPKVYLENVLYNLISNALKYSNSKIPPEIIVSVKVLKNKKTQVIVKDNGLGIDLVKYGHKVFKLNQIFHSGYDSKGVGLYITKTQVESLGGNIVLKSKPDEGCEFIVTL